MFGPTIDYYLLKPLTHAGNRATERELDAVARQTSYTMDEACKYLYRFQTEYFENRFPIDPALSYLDIGCGIGRLSAGLSCAGARM